jgi:hypothetical protein
MKIINRQEFLNISKKVVYAKYGDELGAICIKISNCGLNDFIYQSLTDCIKCNSSEEMFEIMGKAESNSSYNFSLDFNCEQRDGCFNNEEKFMIWNNYDIIGLMGALQECL